MNKIFFLILFSVLSLVALPPNRIAIGSNPAYITPVDNAKNVTPDVVILLVEEELTNSNCSKDSNRSYILVETENPEEMKKYRETIEKDKNNEMIDPDSRITPHFITATHLLKGSAAFTRGCAMVNLRIEDRKGCIIAQKKISVSGIRKPIEIIRKLISEATSSLRYQICNSKSNEQTCSKSHYTDELFCPYYFIINTTTMYSHEKEQKKAKGAVIPGPKVLTDSYTASQKSKQIMYIDPQRGIVKLVGLENDAKNRFEGGGDEFDKEKCAFVYKKRETKVDDNPEPNLAKITRHNILNNNKNSAFIELKVKNNNFTKKFRIPWSTLRANGSWSGNGSKTSTKDDNIENDIKNSTEYMGIFKAGKALINSDILREYNEQGGKGAEILGMSKKQLCTFHSPDRIFTELNDVDLSFDAKINVDISPASRSDIKEFKLYSDAGKVHSIGGQNIVLPKYEKEAKGIFGNLQNSIYENMSDKDKEAWNKADKEFNEKRQNKKDLEEFENLSLDDLEMFTK